MDLNPKFSSTKDWNTTLYECTTSGNFRVMQRSIRRGADINHISNTGNTPLAEAIRRGHIDIIRYLLKMRDPDITKTGPNGKSALHWAIIRNHLEVVKLILSKVTNVHINRRDDHGNPPLIYAVIEKRTPIAELIIKKGADVDACGASGSTPLEEAILAGDFSTVRLLVERKADINRVNFEGNTCLGLAVKSKNKEIVDLLVMKGADVCLCGETGKTPLSWAVLNEDFDLVEVLVESGALWSVPEAFLDAVAMDSLEMVGFFKEKGLLDFVGEKVWEKVWQMGSQEVSKFLRGSGGSLDNGSDSDDSFVKVDVSGDFYKVCEAVC